MMKQMTDFEAVYHYLEYSFKAHILKDGRALVENILKNVLLDRVAVVSWKSIQNNVYDLVFRFQDESEFISIDDTDVSDHLQDLNRNLWRLKYFWENYPRVIVTVFGLGHFNAVLENGNLVVK